MEELSIYNLTITSDHRLKVNNEEVGGDASILPGDSESLLAWALIQVGYIQQGSDSNMALQIEDQRPDGYGIQKVTIPPGRQVLIEAVRKRTGRDLSFITDEVQQRHAAETEAENEQAEAQENDEAQGGEEVKEWESWDEAPEQDPETPEDSTETKDSVWTEEVEAPQESEQALAPPPALVGASSAPTQIPESPAHAPRKRSYEEPLLEREEDSLPEQDYSLEGDHPAEEPQAQDSDAQSLLAQFAPEEEVTEHEVISSPQVSYKRNRPELGEGEAKPEKAKPKKQQSKWGLAALVVVSLIALLLAVQTIRSQGENSYVATCVDERTMVRQNSEEGCKNEEASYYRWWYTPRGSEVPAVNQTVAQDQGTRIRPEEAAIREGFAPEGGFYGGENEGG